MKKCPYCENTGADNETYCCKCGNLMYDEPTSMQQASNASSYTYNTVNPTDGIGKKKKSKALMIILSIIGIFFRRGLSIHHIDSSLSYLHYHPQTDISSSYFQHISHRFLLKTRLQIKVLWIS